MKKLAILFVFYSAAVSAQTSTVSRYPEWYVFDDPNYTVTMEMTDKKQFKYIFDKKDSDKEVDTTFTIINNEQTVFNAAFKRSIKEGLVLSVFNTKPDSVIAQEANKLYYFFKAVEIMGPDLNFKPLAGVIQVNDKLNIEIKGSTDYMLMGMAKERKNELKKELKERKELKKRGLFREKIFIYQGGHYTKQELKQKIFNDTAEYLAKRALERFKFFVLPRYDSFHNQFAIKVTEFQRLQAQLRRNNTAKASLQFQINTAESKLQTDRSIFKSYLVTYKELLARNGFNQRALPDLTTLSRDRVKFQVKREADLLTAKNNSDLKRFAKDTVALKTLIAAGGKRGNSPRLLDVDSLQQELELNRILINELKEEQKNRNRLVARPLDSLLQFRQEYIKDSVEYAQLNRQFTSLGKELTGVQSDYDVKLDTVKSYFRRQARYLNETTRAAGLVKRLPFQITNIDLEFNEGFIENILVVGDLRLDPIKYVTSNYTVRDTVLIQSPRNVKFENRYPIGFSRKRDFENLKVKHLYTMHRKLPQYKLHLEELMRVYVQNHEINRRDFSPADTVLRMTFGDPKTDKHAHNLYKDATFRLFEAKVYSDFVGLDRTNPNGLIQTELDRKVNLITNRYPRKVFKYEMWNFGFLSSITPSLTLSKLEGNNKELVLLYRDEEVNGQYFPQRYASTLELKRHENFSVGFDLNIALLDIPTFKSTLFVDYGFRYGRVAVIDSLRDFNSSTKTSSLNGRVNSFGVNTMQFYPRINWLIRSDERYCFTFSGSLNWYFLRANSFRQVSNEEFFASNNVQGDGRRVYSNVSMMFELKPNAYGKGKLFFRYQYNWQWKFANTGFHQAQVGYSFYLLSNRK